MAMFLKSGVVTHEDDHKLEFIRSMFGGNLKESISASAELPKEFKVFLQVALSCFMIELYAGTEMVGCLFQTKVEDKSCSNVGGPNRTF